MNNPDKKKKKLWIMALVFVMICGQTVQAAGESQDMAGSAEALEASSEGQAAEQHQAVTDQAQPAYDSGQDQTGTDQAKGNTDSPQPPPGTGQSQPGTDQTQPGTDQVQPGTDQVQPGTDQSQPGTDQSQPGTDQTQPGTDQSQAGTDKPQPGTDQSQPGTDKPQPGTGQSESETDQSEPETDKDKGQQGSEKPGDKDKGDKDKGDKKEEGPFLEIDNGRIYKGMDKTFKEGYTPIQSGQKILLVVPFLEKTPIKDNQLQAGVNLGDTSTAPFVFKNYNTTVKKEKYDFKGNVQLDKDKKPVTGKDVEGEASVAETYLLELTLELKEELQAGSYPVEITITGQTESGRKISQKRTFYVTVKPIMDKEKDTEPESGDGQGDEPQDFGGGYSGGGSDAGTGGGEQGPQQQPKVMLEDYSISQVPMLAGEEASVKATFVNTNKSAYIQNIKVTVGVQNNTLKFNRKNFYIEKVDAKGIFEVTFVAEVLKDTVENTDMLTFTIEYEDKEAKAITETEDILLQIGQPIELEAENLDIPSRVYAAETIPVSMKILNLSRTRIYNVRYTIEAEGLLPLESAFVGNMEAGSSAEGTAKIFIGTKDMKETAGSQGSGGTKSGDAETEEAQSGEDGTAAAVPGNAEKEKYGPTSGIVTLSYEDEFGEVYTEEIPFTTTINKPEILTPVIPKEEPETAGQWWISILTGFGGIALVLVILGVRRLFLRKADAYGGKNF